MRLVIGCGWGALRGAPPATDDKRGFVAKLRAVGKEQSLKKANEAHRSSVVAVVVAVSAEVHVVEVHVPLAAWLPLVVGLWLVPQQMPRSVTVPLPALVTLPPPVAVVCVTLVTCEVITVGRLSC